MVMYSLKDEQLERERESQFIFTKEISFFIPLFMKSKSPGFKRNFIIHAAWHDNVKKVLFKMRQDGFSRQILFFSSFLSEFA